MQITIRKLQPILKREFKKLINCRKPKINLIIQLKKHKKINNNKMGKKIMNNKIILKRRKIIRYKEYFMFLNNLFFLGTTKCLRRVK